MQSAQNIGKNTVAPWVTPFAVAPIALIEIAADHAAPPGRCRCVRVNGYNAKENVNRCHTRGRNPRRCGRREQSRRI